jgi:hypothetical protein
VCVCIDSRGGWAHLRATCPGSNAAATDHKKARAHIQSLTDCFFFFRFFAPLISAPSLLTRKRRYVSRLEHFKMQIPFNYRVIIESVISEGVDLEIDPHLHLGLKGDKYKRRRVRVNRVETTLGEVEVVFILGSAEANS